MSESRLADKIHHIYRNEKPLGQYDMIIITIVHLDFPFVLYMAKNIERFVKGSFIWIIHANGYSMNENDLPSWAWLTRTVITTKHPTTTLLHAMTKCIEFGIQNVQFTNCMFVSAGSVFFRDFNVPKEEHICASSHEDIFFPNNQFTYSYPIPIEHLGKCSEYLIKQGGIHYNGWQYKNYFPYGMDLDNDIQDIIKKRGNIQYIKGSHVPGQIFTYTVCEMLVQDMNEYFIKDNVINLM